MTVKERHMSQFVSLNEAAFFFFTKIFVDVVLDHLQGWTQGVCSCTPHQMSNNKIL